MKEKEERSLQYILSEYIRACLVCKFKPQFSMFKCWKMWTQKKNCIWPEGLIKSVWVTVLNLRYLNIVFESISRLVFIFWVTMLSGIIVIILKTVGPTKIWLLTQSKWLYSLSFTRLSLSETVLSLTRSGLFQLSLSHAVEPENIYGWTRNF